MATTGTQIIDRAQQILNDAGAVRWPRADLLDWLNEGMASTARLAPESYTVDANMIMVEGSRQNLTAMAVAAGTEAPLRLIDITHNVTDATGLPALRAVRHTNIKTLNQVNPDWHGDTPNALVDHYLFDSRNPKEFFVYPPQPSSGFGFVAVVYSAIPTPLAVEANNILLDDSYAEPLVDYILHRAFSIDAEYGVNPARVSQHFNQFLAGIMSKTTADLTVEPAPASTPVEDNNSGA